METFKLQRPLFTTGEQECLVYNEDHSFQGLIPLTDELLAIFDHSHKIYIEGHVDDKGILHIEDVTEWQDW